MMKGVTHGASDYLIKPVRIEALKNIWQHVVRKRENEWNIFCISTHRANQHEDPKQLFVIIQIFKDVEILQMVIYSMQHQILIIQRGCRTC